MAEFIGEGLSQGEYDELAFRFVRPAWLEREVPLFGLKWFDYRQLHPTQATYLYAHHLIEAYKGAYATNVDYTKAIYVVAFPNPDLFKNEQKHITAIWRGRQCADAMGMPYDVYLKQAYQLGVRGWGSKNLPRPSQLYNSARIVEPMQAYWEERRQTTPLFAESDHYQNDRYIGTAAQNAHHDYLLEIAGRRIETRAFVLGTFIFDKMILPEVKAVAKFGADIVERARSLFPNGTALASL